MLLTFLSTILLVGSTNGYSGDSPGNCTDIIQVDGSKQCNFWWLGNCRKHKCNQKRQMEDQVLCFKAKSDRVQIGCNMRLHYHCPFSDMNLRVYDGCNGTSLDSERIQLSVKERSCKWTSKKTNCLKVVLPRSRDWKECLYCQLAGDKGGWDSRRYSRRHAPSTRRKTRHRSPVNARTVPRAPAPPRTTRPPPCKEQTFRRERGNFSSPNYPSSYPKNLDCIYKIERPENARIQLTFQAVDLPSRIRGDCKGDIIKVYDGTASWAPLKRDVCGREAANIISSGNRLKIRFRSGQRGGGYGGFKAIYGPYPDSTPTKDDAQKVTGVVIGTACGLVFIAVTVLALCNSRRLSFLHFRRRDDDVQSSYVQDAVQDRAPPAYDEVMNSPEKYPIANEKPPPPYPGIILRVDPEHEVLISDQSRDIEEVERASDIDSNDVSESHDDVIREADVDVREGGVSKNDITESDVRSGSDVEDDTRADTRDEGTRINDNGATGAESILVKQSHIVSDDDAATANEDLDDAASVMTIKSSVHEYPNAISTDV